MIANPLHGPTDSKLHWTTTNVGEATPGVQTPLSCSLWSCGNEALREMAYRVGAISRREWRTGSDTTDRVFRPFYGRATLQVDFFARLGDRLPGSTGAETVRALLGRVPDSLVAQPTRKRYPIVALRLPYVFLSTPRRLARSQPMFADFYVQSVDSVAFADLAAATEVFGVARTMLADALTLQALAASGVVQPLYEAVGRLVKAYSVGDVGLLSGDGGAEVAGLVSDLWRASRDEISIDDVVRCHGFHGPLEGEAASRVWRDDPTPLEKIIGDYRKLPAEESPAARLRRRQQQRQHAVDSLLSRVPATHRPAIRLLLHLAEKNIPLRGVAKRFMLQSLDVCRLAARRIAEHLVSEGALDSLEDIFYLTADEIVSRDLLNLRAVVTDRRRLHAEYQSLELPSDWRGMPTPILTATTDVDVELSGVGVSQGITEGVVRVITTPDFMDVERGDILVAPTTDPSWSAVMMVCGAAVVDIGGALSHAAIVARELGIPCVVNTRNGSRVLRTGDRIRVDGGSGVVTVLERVQSK